MKTQRLKPLLGIRPGIYITAVLLLILLAVLFWAFMLPGIQQYGSKVTIATDAPGAAVFIDGVFAGSTPLEVFIPAGEREIRVTKPYFQEKARREHIGGRLLFTRFAPRSAELSFELTMDDLAGYLTWRIQDLYQWSLITNYTETYQYPRIISETAADIAALPGAAESREFAEFIALLPYLASTDQISADIAQAADELGFTPPGSPEESTVSSDVRSRDTLQLEGLGLEFISVSGETVDPFYIASSLVSSDLFAAFTADEPFWHEDNREELMDLELVDDTYLYSHNQLTDRIINISYYAAAAFAEWADQQYNKYTITLPGALHWEHAAQALGSSRLDTMWQWTESPFYPGAPGQYERQHALLDLKPHYLLKGGDSRQAAALPPSACSPVTGIRLLLIKD